MRRYPVLVSLAFAAVLVAAPSVGAQTATPAPTEPAVTLPPTQAPTQPPVDLPDVPTEEPAAPVDTTNDDDDGLSSTAIILIVGGAVVLLALIVFAASVGRGRRPGDPGPP